MNETPDDPPITLDEWRAAAKTFRESVGLDDSFAKEVQETFSRAIVKQYWKPLYDTIMQRTKQSERIWSTVLGVDRATIYRWRGDLVGDNNRAKEPTLHYYLKSLAAFDLDGAILPRGLHATIAAYRETFDYIYHRLTEKRPLQGITDEEVLYLHLAVRSQDWQEACKLRDAERRQLATANLVRRVGRIVKQPTASSFQGIQSILRERFVPWSILETVILYEWIQS